MDDIVLLKVTFREEDDKFELKVAEALLSDDLRAEAQNVVRFMYVALAKLAKKVGLPDPDVTAGLN